MKKGRKSVILTAALSIMLCVSVVVGATFALFATKDEVNIAVSSANVNVTAAISNLEVYSPTKIDIETGTITDPANIATTDGNKGTFAALGTAAINGNELTLDRMAAGDKVTFEITVKNNSNIKTQYRTRMITGEDDGLFDELDVKIGSFTGRGITDWKSLEAASAEGEVVEVLDCEITLPADSAVMGESCTISFLVEAVQFNADAKNDIKYYSLSEFNALTEIPEEVKTVYVSMSGVSLEGGITIGNKNIVDDYEYFTADQTEHGKFTKDMNYKKTLNVNGVDIEKYLYSTEKAGFDLILTGAVRGAKDTGGFNAGMIELSVPDSCNVIFDKVSFGAGQMALRSWYEALSYDPSFHTHKVAKVVFDGCVFNGNWIQNGGGFMGKAASTDNMTFVDCTFNKYENKAGINSDGFDNRNNSNPIWIQNLGHCNVTIENCVINAVRPIKMWESGASGAVTIKNNTFNMSKCSIDTESTHKNIGVMFCGSPANVKLGNVEITGNTVNGDATAFVGFYSQTSYPSIEDGATFKLSGNTLNGAKESVLWKTETEWKPDYVTE